ncbi:MAG: OadG family protein [Planctomycetota bacterium]
MNTTLHTLATCMGSPEWNQKMNEGFGIFVLGIATVFVNLAILMIIINIVGAITGGKSKKNVPDNRSNA